MSHREPAFERTGRIDAADFRAPTIPLYPLPRVPIHDKYRVIVPRNIGPEFTSLVARGEATHLIYPERFELVT